MRVKKLRKRLSWNKGKTQLVIDDLRDAGRLAIATWWAGDKSEWLQVVGRVLGRGERTRLTSAGLDLLDERVEKA